jgi:xanthine dehydrogenase molybdenum-binding subunit
MKTGAMIDGRIVAHQARILGDTGAYASLGGPVMTRAATHSTGPYEVPNVDVDCYAVYTNNPPAGAFRGFGATQSQFAAESQMDLVAKALGMSPFEIRRINALRPGSLTATGQRLDESVGLLECLDKLEVAVQAAEAEEGPQEIPADIRRAWGVAAAYKNIGLGGGLADSGRAAVELKAGGRVIVKVGAADVGQGLHDVLRQIVAETLGVQVTEIDVILGDTDLTPNAGATTASRQTYVAGNAALMAAAQIRDGLRVTAAQALGCEPAAVSFTCGTANAPGNGRMLPWPELVSLAMRERGVLHAECTYTPPATVALGAEGPVHFAFGYGAQAAQVEVNTRTGKVRVLRVIAAQDAGKAINPLALEGQVEGGVMMGIGYALIENFVVQDGVVVTDTLAKYKVPTIMDAPRIDSILVEHPTRDGPFGAKGIGELTSMPTAPAVVNAVARAIGYRSYSLPIKREDIRQAVIWSREALSVLQPEMMEANL